MERTNKKITLLTCCGGEEFDPNDAFYAIIPSLISNLLFRILGTLIEVYFFSHTSEIHYYTSLSQCAEIENHFSNGSELKKNIKNILGSPESNFCKSPIMKPAEFPTFFQKLDLTQTNILIILFSDHGNTKSLLLNVIKTLGMNDKKRYCYHDLSKDIQMKLEKNPELQIIIILESCSSSDLLIHLENQKISDRVSFLGYNGNALVATAKKKNSQNYNSFGGYASICLSNALIDLLKTNHPYSLFAHINQNLQMVYPDIKDFVEFNLSAKKSIEQMITDSKNKVSITYDQYFILSNDKIWNDFGNIILENQPKNLDSIRSCFIQYSEIMFSVKTRPTSDSSKEM